MQTFKTEESRDNYDKTLKLVTLEDEIRIVETEIANLIKYEEERKKESERLVHLEEVLYSVKKEAKLRSPLYAIPLSSAALIVLLSNPLTALGFAGCIGCGLVIGKSIHTIEKEYPQITEDGSKNIFKVLKELRKSRREVKIEFLENEDKISKTQTKIEDKYKELEDLEQQRRSVLASKYNQDLSESPVFQPVLSQYKKDTPKVYGIRMQGKNGKGDKK